MDYQTVYVPFRDSLNGAQQHDVTENKACGRQSQQATCLFTMMLCTKYDGLDVDSAFRWLQKAAEQGHPRALRKLVEYYKTGEYTKCPRDLKQSALLLKQAEKYDANEQDNNSREEKRKKRTIEDTPMWRRAFVDLERGRDIFEKMAELLIFLSAVYTTTEWSNDIPHGCDWHFCSNRYLIPDGNGFESMSCANFRILCFNYLENNFTTALNMTGLCSCITSQTSYTSPSFNWYGIFKTPASFSIDVENLNMAANFAQSVTISYSSNEKYCNLIVVPITLITLAFTFF